MGQDAQVFLSSAEVAAVAAIKGHLPSVDEYVDHATALDAMAADVYRYLEFDKLPDFSTASPRV